MSDLVVGLGIALVLEGLLWALGPDIARRMVREIGDLPAQHLSVMAWCMVAAGLCLVWMVRG